MMINNDEIITVVHDILNKSLVLFQMVRDVDRRKFNPTMNHKTHIWKDQEEKASQIRR